ncbi:MAG: hypothetical protein U9N63_04980 [Pseudomonadota bacterium]|nr:hypothetical protein [Pseudomonadota bacterium]
MAVFCRINSYSTVVDTKREEKMAELEGTEIRLRIREKRMVFLQELVEELIPKVIDKKMTNKEIVHLLDEAAIAPDKTPSLTVLDCNF